MVLKSAAEDVVADRPSSLDEGFNAVPIGRTDPLSNEAHFQGMLRTDEGFDDGFRPRRAIGAKETCPTGGAGVVPCSCGRADNPCGAERRSHAGQVMICIRGK